MKPGDELIDLALLLVRKRRSCRSMVPGKVPHNVLRAVLTAGVWAPTGSNSQNVRFLVLETPERMRELAEFKAPKPVVGQASAGIMVLTERVELPPKEDYIWKQLWPQNAAAAIQNMLLVATAAGLASCWVSFVSDMNCTRLVSGQCWWDLFPEYDIPRHWDAQGLVLLGWPRETEEDGFPKGDETHGGRPVVRPPLERFVLKPKG